MLTPRTISKIKIVGNNRDKWRPDLFEMISPDNLPAQNGGALTTCTKVSLTPLSYTRNKFFVVAIMVGKRNVGKKTEN